MTQAQEELLWKYIDGSCTQEEIQEYHILMTDTDIHAEYLKIESIHDNLHEQAVTTAPSNLISNTMLTLLKEEPQLSKVPPINYRPLIFLLSLVFSSTLILALIPMTKAYNFKWLSDGAKRMTDIHIDLSVFANLGNMSIVLLAIPFLVLIDQVLIKKRIILTL